MRGQVEQLGERLAQETRDLRGRPERQLARARVPVGETGPILHRHARVAVEAEAVADDHGGTRHRRVGVAPDKGARQEDVAPGRLVNERPGATSSCRAPLSGATPTRDRKSTRLNSSHDQISYAVFCLKNKTN